MLTNMKISTRLLISFALTLLFMAVVGGVGFWGVTKLADELHHAVHVDAKMLELAERVRTNVIIMRRYEKDIFLNIEKPEKVSEYRKKWDEAAERIGVRLSALEKIASTAADKEFIANTRKELAVYFDGVKKVNAAIDAGEIKTPQDGNKAIGAYKEATHKIEKMTWDYAAVGDKRMEEISAKGDKVSASIKSSLIALILVSLVLSIILMGICARSITKPLSSVKDMLFDIAKGRGDLTARLNYHSRDELGEICSLFNDFVEKLHGIIREVTNCTLQVASAATQLQASAEQIATGAEEVAAQASTVATAGEEMSATSSDIAMNCMRAAEGSSMASATATTGAAVVDKTVQVMSRIASRVQDTAKTVESLGDRSDQIGAIVSTIEDIADQTNLVALNAAIEAAIEAARAGEQGRGFAVVADEVRALAERTTKATREIGEMIKAIQSETKSAVAAMVQGVKEVEQGTSEAAKSGQALEEILAQINAVTMQVSQVATAAEEQTATTTEISNNIHQITDVVQMTASGAQESASAASQLSRTAEELQRLVGQFKL